MKTEIEKILHKHHANQLSTDNAINEVLRLFSVSGNEANPKEIKKDGEVAVSFAEWMLMEGFNFMYAENKIRYYGSYNHEETTPYTIDDIYEKFELSKAKATDR